MFLRLAIWDLNRVEFTPGIPEQFPNLLGVGAGSNIEILGGDTDKQVTDCPAYNIGIKIAPFEFLDDLDGIPVHQLVSYAVFSPVVYHGGGDPLAVLVYSVSF